MRCARSRGSIRPIRDSLVEVSLLLLPEDFSRDISIEADKSIDFICLGIYLPETTMALSSFFRGTGKRGRYNREVTRKSIYRLFQMSS